MAVRFPCSSNVQTDLTITKEWLSATLSYIKIFIQGK